TYQGIAQGNSKDNTYQGIAQRNFKDSTYQRIAEGNSFEDLIKEAMRRQKQQRIIFAIERQNGYKRSKNSKYDRGSEL
ncbi:hypothetical protein, partial [Candidatus Enterococcus wittei]|uniref:hypothetical protein n=1 Tax=Candidatus Enterococcus wittei TaxID=1987383 RepID=UPI0015C502B0